MDKILLPLVLVLSVYIIFTGTAVAPPNGTSSGVIFIFSSSSPSIFSQVSSPSYLLVISKFFFSILVPAKTSPFSSLAPMYLAEISSIFLSSALTLTSPYRPIVITKQSKIDMKPTSLLFFITKYPFPKFPIFYYIGIFSPSYYTSYKNFSPLIVFPYER